MVVTKIGHSKHCPACRMAHPLVAFGFDRRSRDRRMYICRVARANLRAAARRKAGAAGRREARAVPWMPVALIEGRARLLRALNRYDDDLAIATT